DDLRRFDDFPSLARKAGEQLHRLSHVEQITLHGALLRSARPHWYASWLVANARHIVLLMLESGDAAALGTLSDTIAADQHPLYAVALAITSGAPIEDSISDIAQLDEEAQEHIGACLYGRWLNGEDGFTHWQKEFVQRLPPSLLKHAS